MFKKLLLPFLIVFVVYTLCDFMKGGSYLQIKNIEGPTLTSIVIVILDIHDLLHCTYRCKRRYSISLYYSEKNQKCYCNKGTDSTINESLEDDGGIIYGFFGESSKVPNATNSLLPRPDCSKHYDDGVRENGVYPLYINDQVVSASCIMNNEDGYGTMTVFQSRDGGNLSFYRKYDDYINGFGDPSGEHWLGLKFIANLTNEMPTGLYMYISPQEYSLPTETIIYTSFHVDPDSSYTVSVENFKTSCTNRSDFINFGNGSKFSTFDSNDSYFAECAESAWWFATCVQFDLNGPIHEGVGSSILNVGCWGFGKPIKRTIMAIIH